MSDQINIRNVSKNDLEIVFTWINDPEVRKMFLENHIITWDEHVNWFNNKFNDPNHRYYIGIDKNSNPVGQIRFEISSRNADVSVLVDPNQRGHRLGIEIIKKGSEYLFNETDITTIHAYIKPYNEHSCRAFENAGYQKTGITQCKEQTVYHYILKRPKRVINNRAMS